MKYTPRRKFGNRKVEYQGIKFDSILECAVYQMLRLLEIKGEIKIIELQPTVHLSEASILVKPDFKCEELKTHQIYFVEAKGFETAIWRLKKRLWKAYAHCKMDIWSKNRKGIYLSDTIFPDREYRPYES